MRNPRFTFALVLGAALAGSTLLAGCGSDDGGPTGPGSGPTWSTGILGPGGGSAQRTFTEDGSWGYRCGVHPAMTATVNVGPAMSNPESTVVTITSSGGPMRFEPASANVRTGGYVRWINQDGTNHSAVR